MSTLAIRRVVCRRCKYTWQPRLTRPKKCPMCSSYHWDEKPKTGRRI